MALTDGHAVALVVPFDDDDAEWYERERDPAFIASIAEARKQIREGKSLSQICQQIKEPARNGGRTLDMLHEHLAHDDLVAWGWSPGEGREPAPGTQAQLGELTKAWIDSGAQCPP